jgi:hypothetical protein
MYYQNYQYLLFRVDSRIIIPISQMLFYGFPTKTNPLSKMKGICLINIQVRNSLIRLKPNESDPTHGDYSNEGDLVVPLPRNLANH